MSFQEIDSGIFLVRLPMADKKNADFTQKNIHTIIDINIYKTLIEIYTTAPEY